MITYPIHDISRHDVQIPGGQELFDTPTSAAEYGTPNPVPVENGPMIIIASVSIVIVGGSTRNQCEILAYVSFSMTAVTGLVNDERSENLVST